VMLAVIFLVLPKVDAFIFVELIQMPPNLPAAELHDIARITGVFLFAIVYFLSYLFLTASPEYRSTDAALCVTYTFFHRFNICTFCYKWTRIKLLSTNKRRCILQTPDTILFVSSQATGYNEIARLVKNLPIK
jgi:hypothetical protein